PSPVVDEPPGRRRRHATGSVLVPAPHAGMRPHERLVPRIEPRVVRIVNVLPALHRRMAVPYESGKASHHVTNLALGVEDDAARMGEIRARTVEAEQVREARH